MDPVSTLFVAIGLIAIVAGLVFVAVTRQAMKRTAWGIVAVGAILTASGFFITPLLFATSAGPATAPSGASISVASATAPALPSGCTLYTATNNIFCTVVFNKTSNALYIQPALADSAGHGSGTGHGQNYLQAAWKMIRTDAINTTFSFGATVVTIPTFNSLGATPTGYSPVGYKAATSSTNGQWQVFPGQGTLANQYPTGNAPGAATNVITTGVPIQSFSSALLSWHISLAGGNSTSFPQTAAQAWANNTQQIMAFSFANAGSLSAWTVSFDILGWDP